jgi:hypothetical protein
VFLKQAMQACLQEPGEKNTINHAKQDVCFLFAGLEEGVE